MWMIALVLLLIGAGLLLWKSWTPEGFDFKLGLAALGAIAVVAFEWFTAGLSSLIQ